MYLLVEWKQHDPNQLASQKPVDLDLHILKQDISSIRMVLVKQFNNFV